MDYKEFEDGFCRSSRIMSAVSKTYRAYASRSEDFAQNDGKPTDRTTLTFLE